MVDRDSKAVVCEICKQPKHLDEVMPAHSIRAAIVEEIKKKHPDWSPHGFICLRDLDEFRAAYMQHSLQAEKGELSRLEQQVLKAVQEQELLVKNVDNEFETKLSMGQRVADKVAEFGGSWTFIIIFGSIIFLWIVSNTIALLQRPFDPFPFILLNLVLSCLAAVQAPVIMMSQNRQEAKDRLRGEHDYQVNLKAEMEIRSLHQKIDHLLHHEWQRLLEIQEIQMDLMREAANSGNSQEKNDQT
jgi:uncharacterized membrane protein